jgi:hypothetical protein
MEFRRCDNVSCRAELATEEMMTLAEIVLENFVIVKQNPEYLAQQERSRKKTSM